MNRVTNNIKTKSAGLFDGRLEVELARLYEHAHRQDYSPYQSSLSVLDSAGGRGGRWLKRGFYYDDASGPTTGAAAQNGAKPQSPHGAIVAAMRHKTQ